MKPIALVLVICWISTASSAGEWTESQIIEFSRYFGARDLAEERQEFEKFDAAVPSNDRGTMLAKLWTKFGSEEVAIVPLTKSNISVRESILSYLTEYKKIEWWQINELELHIFGALFSKNPGIRQSATNLILESNMPISRKRDFAILACNSADTQVRRRALIFVSHLPDAKSILTAYISANKDIGEQQGTVSLANDKLRNP